MRLFVKRVKRLKTLRTLRKSLRSLRLKSKIIILKSRGLREGWQRKSSVERSGTEIAANDLTEFTANCLVK